MKIHLPTSQKLRTAPRFSLRVLLATVVLALLLVAGLALARGNAPSPATAASLSAMPMPSATLSPIPTPSPSVAKSPVSPEIAKAAVSALSREAPISLLGDSGLLRAAIGRAEMLAQALPASFTSGTPFASPGIHDLGLVTPGGQPFYFVSLLPFETKTGSKLDGYHIGNWPSDYLTAGNAKYALPAGFIEVTQQNLATPVSEHFHLGDFITHDQTTVWPKYLVLQPRLLDKLELIEAELKREGLPSKLHVMSGFRTPQYNEQGVGPGGRATHSRHMYGDASDVFVDQDGNGVMDDLNGDGKINIEDAKVLFHAAEVVEVAHPDLVGGLSAYNATSAHGPFVHVDARGFKARW